MVRPGVLLVGVALCASAGAAPRHGKVVRIERHAKRQYGTPRYCAFSIGDLQAYCYGKKPEIGERITVLDTHRIVGVAHVDNVEPLGSCPASTTGLWLAHVQAESGDLVTPGDTQIGALVDVVLDPRGARLVKVERVPGDRPLTVDQVIGVDTDGDAAPDLEFLAFPCDDQGQPPSTAGVATGQCMEVWGINGHSAEHLRTDRISQNC
jgi:hypothetical protein